MARANSDDVGTVRAARDVGRAKPDRRREQREPIILGGISFGS